MNTFQIVFIAFCAFQAALSLRRFLKTRHLTAFVFLGAWLAAIALIANPGVSTQIAQSVGILWAHYQHYLRYKRVENEVTLLVRELAIAQAARPSDSGKAAA
jgi:hypothetical protein